MLLLTQVVTGTDASGIEHMINAVGFPIFAFLTLIIVGKYLFDKMTQQSNENFNKMQELQEKQDESLDAVRDALNNNTAVIQNLRGIIETLISMKNSTRGDGLD